MVMANDQLQFLQPDDWRINVKDAWQVLWWCRHLAITKNQLEDAVASVGCSVADIRRYLNRQEQFIAVNTPPSQAPNSGAHLMSRSRINRSPF
jgi:hypothetical protein